MSERDRNHSETNLSKGARAHIRILKAAGQTNEASIFRQQSLDSKTRLEQQKAADKARISDLTDMLELALTETERADYTIERMFLELKLETRGWSEHGRALTDYLDNLPHEISDYLDGKIPDGKGGDTSRLLQIRDRVIPKEQLDRLMSRK